MCILIKWFNIVLFRSTANENDCYVQWTVGRNIVKAGDDELVRWRRSEDGQCERGSRGQPNTVSSRGYAGADTDYDDRWEASHC